MNQTQLKSDLDEIERGVNRADMAEPVKRILRDMLEWNRGLVDQASSSAASNVAERLDVIEDAVDELLHGAEEGISLESAKVILTALEQSRLLCATLAATLEKSPFDDLTTERFVKMVKTCQQSVAVAMQTTQELVIPDENDPDEVTTVPNGPAENDEDADEAVDDEDADDADDDDLEDVEGEEEVDNG